MRKEIITYEDFNGQMQSDPAWFYLSDSELTRLTIKHDGGMDKKLQNMAERRDSREMLETFEEIVCSAYGVKSDDGKRFDKNARVLEDFKNSEMYNILFLNLMTDAKFASDFINDLTGKTVKEHHCKYPTVLENFGTTPITVIEGQ